MKKSKNNKGKVFPLIISSEKREPNEFLPFSGFFDMRKVKDVLRNTWKDFFAFLTYFVIYGSCCKQK